MNTTFAGLIVTVIAYLAGSLPFGFLTARFVAGIDIRSEGSGNIGATNVARVLGTKYGIFVLCLDCLKGLLPVLLLPMLFEWLVSNADASGAVNHIRVACGVMTIVGHMFPCWLLFRGGKGVATALGVVLVVSWKASLAAFVVFVVVFVIARIVSLGSILAAITFAGFQMWRLMPEPFSKSNWSEAAFSLVIPLLIIYRHRSNLTRLLKGEEPRFESGGKRLESDSTE
jgi:glycerol-3-phosphate acyltransferase PlsY